MKGTDHLNYQELRRVVLDVGPGSHIDEDMERIFDSTFDRVMMLVGEQRPPDQTYQWMEMQVLRMLVDYQMTGDLLRELFNVMDYKAGYITVQFMLYFDSKAQPKSETFRLLHSNRAQDVEQFYANPYTPLTILKVYEQYLNNRERRFYPFVTDRTRRLLNQIALDMTTYPLFKRMDLTDRSTGTGVLEVVQAMSMVNATAPASIIPEAERQAVDNPLFRVVGGTAVHGTFTTFLADWLKLTKQKLLDYGMVTDLDDELLGEILQAELSALSFTPGFVYALCVSCGMNTQRACRIIMAMHLWMTTNEVQEHELFYGDVIGSIQHFLQHHAVKTGVILGQPRMGLWMRVKKEVPDDRILFGQIGSIIHELDLEPNDVEELQRDRLN